MVDYTHTMSAGDAARALGISEAWLRRLDDELKPVRGANGRRRYNPAAVKALAEKRAKAA